MRGILSIFNKNKKTTSLSVVLGAMMVVGLSAMAADADTAVVSSMTDAFGSIKATALAALTAIAGIAILLFGAIYAWRYGKKVFTIISK